MTIQIVVGHIKKRVTRARTITSVVTKVKNGLQILFATREEAEIFYARISPALRTQLGYLPLQD